MGAEKNLATDRDQRLEPASIDPAFIVPIEHRPSSGGHQQTDEIPLIDLSPLQEQNPPGDEARKRVAREVGLACEEWGFFRVVNHGIRAASVARVMEASRAFFARPIHEKLRVKRSAENSLGYNDGELTKNTRDWKEIFDIAADGAYVFPAQGDEDEDGADVRVFPNVWPPDMPSFRKACEEYMGEAGKLAFTLLGLIAESLGLPRAAFDEHFAAGGASCFRLNHYPPCPAPHLALGVGRHKDSGALTVLLQDQVGGLQVKTRSGTWIDVKPDDRTLVVNVGDVIQVLSNDKYRSVEHRVVVNGSVDRYSFPFLLHPAHCVNVCPRREFVDADHPPRYRPISWASHIQSINDSNFKDLGVENRQIHDYAIAQ